MDAIRGAPASAANWIPFSASLSLHRLSLLRPLLDRENALVALPRELLALTFKTTCRQGVEKPAKA